jgi:hypothetical protein
MESPDTAPVPQTEAGATVDISVDLVAPSTDGIYTGFFELRKANGDPLAIGTGNTFWVKILIGNVSIPTVAPVPLTPSNNTPVSQPKGPASCKYVGSPYYPNEIANLINTARTQNGLPTLSINAQLTAAAQGHSIDMACHGLLSHTGSDASSVYERIVASGYVPSYSEEIIYAGGYPQTAFDWWMNDQIHRDAILNPNAIEMGVGTRTFPIAHMEAISLWILGVRKLHNYPRPLRMIFRKNFLCRGVVQSLHQNFSRNIAIIGKGKNLWRGDSLATDRPSSFQSVNSTFTRKQPPVPVWS